jgi:DNA end-binding protein Ku
MVVKLIGEMSDTWDPASYHDTFRDDVLALVDKKIRAGTTEEVGEVEEAHEARRSADIVDLSELLERSLGHGKSKRSSAGKNTPRRGHRAA